MNLHEYQAKKLFSDYGLPVPKGVVARSVEEALGAINVIVGDDYVIKAQVHAGGRGKAGGVRLVKGRDQLQENARALLHTQLVTYQTDAQGQPINELLVEELTQIARELYLGIVIDRSTQKITFMFSTEGGVEIEKVAESTPEKILKFSIDPLIGVMPYQCREMGFQLGLTLEQIKELTHITQGLGKMFIEKDLCLLEVNPLVVTKAGHLLCLDGKINIDDNALYRQPDLRLMRDSHQEDERENLAKEWELSYIALDGNIGCMVNGAGLAMATMDLIKLQGGNPANFLDVGGGATKERVTQAFKIILSDTKVKGILVNIFGGIVRCDLIAQGIISAVQEVGILVPVVVRLEGNQSKAAKIMLDDLMKEGFNICAATSLLDAAQQIVKKVQA